MLLNVLIKTPFPVWFFIFCILAGAIYSGLLYYKSNFTSEKSFFSFPNIMLAFLRLASVSAISYFLLSPFITKLFSKDEKPIIIIALDNSKSILLSKDSVFYKTKYREEIEKMVKSISGKFEVQTYIFGNKVEKGDKLDFSMTRTNISDMLENISELNFNRNIGAFVLASDGIYNEGKDPLPVTADFRSLFFTIALGDTAVRKDVLIKDVSYNSVAYQGNTFTIRAKISARKFNNSSVNVQILHGNQIVCQKKIDITNDYFNAVLDFPVEAKQSGLQRYTIRFDNLPGDINLTNNSRDIYIDILENRKKILILADSPHPDVYAIKKSIEKNDNYKVTSALISDVRKSNTDITKLLSGYDVIFLHQLPSFDYPANEIFDIAAKLKTPLFIIVGSKTALGRFNSVLQGLGIVQRGNSFNSVLPSISGNFDYFSISANLKNIIPQMPPLSCPFGDYKLSSDNEVMLFQKIGMVTTNYPLLVFMNNIDNRLAVLCGEGIWRWAMYEYSINQDQSAFDELINKSVQYLSLKSDKRFFRLKNPKLFFYEDETVTFEAEVFNQSYEKLENAKIKMQITDQNNKKFDYNFQESESDYKLNAGYFTPGNYYYNTSVFLNGKENKITGAFSVKPVDVEFINTVADHKLLYSIAKNNEGKMFYPDQISKLTQTLKKLKDIKPISHLDQEIRDLIDLRWLFFLILFLLVTEWFFRKFFGEL